MDSFFPFLLLQCNLRFNYTDSIKTRIQTNIFRVQAYAMFWWGWAVRRGYEMSLEKIKIICFILSFGLFPCVWIFCPDITEHSVCSISLGILVHTTKEDIIVPWNVGTRNSDVGESSKRKTTISTTRRKCEIKI